MYFWSAVEQVIQLYSWTSYTWTSDAGTGTSGLGNIGIWEIKRLWDGKNSSNILELWKYL